MAVTTSSRSSFSQSRQLLSNSLSKLSTSLYSSSASTPRDLTAQVDQVIQDSFKGEWVKREELPEGEKWKFDTRRVIVEKGLDELIQAAVSTESQVISTPVPRERLIA